MVAQRMMSIARSGTAKTQAAAAAAAAAGREITDLSAGEVWVDPPQSVQDGAVAAIRRGENRYTDTVGLAPLRRAIAKRVSADTGQVWNADEVAVTAGGKQALFNAAMAVLDPGSEVIVPVPYWTTFPAQIRLAGATPVFVDTAATGYRPRLRDLEAAVTAATRAIIVNTPNNPTGAVFDGALLAGIADLAMRRDLWIVFDECYGRLVHGPTQHEHIIAVAPAVRPRTLVVNSFSKTLALTGWRLGYLAAPNTVINAVKSIQSHTTSNPNVIAQHAVMAYLEENADAFERELRTVLAERCGSVRRLVAGLTRVSTGPSEGGFYLYLDLSRILPAGAVADADGVARLLLDKAGVSVVPGSAFGDPMGLRLSYGVAPTALRRGLPSLVRVLDDLCQRSERTVA